MRLSGTEQSTLHFRYALVFRDILVERHRCSVYLVRTTQTQPEKVEEKITPGKGTKDSKFPANINFKLQDKGRAHRSCTLGQAMPLAPQSLGYESYVSFRWAVTPCMPQFNMTIQERRQGYPSAWTGRLQSPPQAWMGYPPPPPPSVDLTSIHCTINSGMFTKATCQLQPNTNKMESIS